MKIRVLFQPQNCAAYVDKNQLQKCYQKINSEQEPGTQAFFFNFCLIYFCRDNRGKG